MTKKDSEFYNILFKNTFKCVNVKVFSTNHVEIQIELLDEVKSGYSKKYLFIYFDINKLEDILINNYPLEILNVEGYPYSKFDMNDSSIFRLDLTDTFIEDLISLLCIEELKVRGYLKSIIKEED